MKIAFIIQRYGREIPGGAETLARQIAERQARRHHIDVLTTTARDYVTWKNEYPESEEKLRGVRVMRFPVEKERNLEEFNKFSDWIYANPHSREDELKWLEMQGPVAPKLIEYLKKEHRKYDLLVFFSYLYYPTYYGLQIAPEKSVLVPTAHDEPPLKLDIYKEVFDNASSFIFNTEAEELLVLERFDVHRKMRETIGIGMELLDAPDTAAFRKRHRVSNRFLLYAGRIDEGKGCGELFNFFRLFREDHPDNGNLQLVLIGKKNMSIPSSRDFRYLGFVDEDDKLAAMAAATAVVIPSRLESLSIVALEAFSVGTPIIVHGGSRVLVDHCRKANAGLYYTSYEEFEGIVEALLGDKNLVRGLGRQGQQYIKENFGWEKLLPLYDLAFRSSAREPRPSGPPERRPERRPPDRRPDRRRRERGWRDRESRERRPPREAPPPPVTEEPAPEEVPVPEEAAVPEEAPAAEEAPLTEQTVPLEEARAPEEATVLEEALVPEEEPNPFAAPEVEEPEPEETSEQEEKREPREAQEPSEAPEPPPPEKTKESDEPEEPEEKTESFP